MPRCSWCSASSCSRSGSLTDTRYPSSDPAAENRFQARICRYQCADESSPGARGMLLALGVLALVASACGGGQHKRYVHPNPRGRRSRSAGERNGGTLAPRSRRAQRISASTRPFASDPASQRIAFVTCETLLTYADEPGGGRQDADPGACARASERRQGRPQLHVRAERRRCASRTATSSRPPISRPRSSASWIRGLKSPGAPPLRRPQWPRRLPRRTCQDDHPAITISAGGITFHPETRAAAPMLARVASRLRVPVVPASTPAPARSASMPGGRDGRDRGPTRLAAPRDGGGP